MPETQKTSNVKIYDRPDRKGLPPMMLALGLLLLLIVGFMVYKFAFHSSDAPAANGAAASGTTNTGAAGRAQSSP